MEPERPIEKLLRAFAKKRRDNAGAPMELHSAMRRQLQDEVARRTARSGSGGWFSSLFVGLRPKLVFAVCFIGLITVGFILLPNLNRPKPSTLASANLPRETMTRANKMTPAPERLPASGPVVTAAGEGTRVEQDKQQQIAENVAKTPAQQESTRANRRKIVSSAETLKREEVLDDVVAKADASAGVTVASTPPVAKETFDFKANTASSAGAFGGTPALSKDAVVPLQPTTPPTVVSGLSTSETALAENEKKLSLQNEPVSAAPSGAAFYARAKTENATATPPISQLFNRADVSGTRSRPTEAVNGSLPLLNSFRVEQVGNTMRVLDADGSVYTGAVQVIQPAVAGRVTPPKNVSTFADATKSTANSEAFRNYSFRVAGTNRNLNQNVVFSGNLIPLTNAQLVDKGWIGGAGGAASAPEPSYNLLWSNSRISGTAVIGDQKGIEVIATPAP